MKCYHLKNGREGSFVKNRNAFTIFEALISMILIGAILSISIPAFRVVNIQRKSVDERFHATIALANLGEQISAENDWGSLKTDNLSRYEISQTKLLNLKKPQLKVTLIENETDPLTRQIRLRLSWKNHHGEMVDPLLLSLWFHRGESSNE